MPHLFSRITLGTALIACCIGAAQAQQVTVQDAWVRATVPHQKATGAFMRLKSGKDMRLMSVSTPAAPIAEVHAMKMVNNVMKMRAVPSLDVPAGKIVELQPGGYHLMLMDLPAQVKAGDTVALILVFQDNDGQRETVQVHAQARGMATTAAPAGGGSAGHGEHGGMHQH
jgi:periplasmic copper chaperone A